MLLWMEYLVDFLIDFVYWSFIHHPCWHLLISQTVYRLFYISYVGAYIVWKWRQLCPFLPNSIISLLVRISIEIVIVVFLPCSQILKFYPYASWLTFSYMPVSTLWKFASIPHLLGGSLWMLSLSNDLPHVLTPYFSSLIY